MQLQVRGMLPDVQKRVEDEWRHNCMKEMTYQIRDRLGIHARPAGLLVKAAAEFPCQITLEKDGKSVDAKRILGVMGLGVKCGQEITLKCEGEREEEALEVLGAFLRENL